jgi:hypothetical protein
VRPIQRRAGYQPLAGRQPLAGCEPVAGRQPLAGCEPVAIQPGGDAAKCRDTSDLDGTA